MARIENVRFPVVRLRTGEEFQQEGFIDVTHWGGRTDGAEVEISEVKNVGPMRLARVLMPAEQVRELITALAETLPENDRVTLAAEIAGITLEKLGSQKKQDSGLQFPKR